LSIPDRDRPRALRSRAGIHPAGALALVASALALVGIQGGCARWMGGEAGDGSFEPDASALPEADASLDASGPYGGVDPDAALCEGDPQPVPLGDLAAGSWQPVSLDPCRAGRHASAGAAGQTLRVRLREAAAPLSITVTDDHGEILASGQTTTAEPQAELPFPVEASGGIHVAVTPRDPQPATSYEIRLDCEAGCDLEATRYPVVLVHGAGGEMYFGTPQYFFGVEGALQERGYRVYTPALPAYAHSSQRAQALADALDDLLAETGASRAHLIGHSQAGLDFRVLLSPQGLAYGDRVATATTLSTPHLGLHPSFAGLSTYFGMDVTEAYLSGEFAQRYPDPPGTPRFSWAAATCGAYELTCLDTHHDEVVAAALASSYLSLRNLYGTDGHGGDNDGVVPVSTAAWGTFLGVLPADHWDLVGQIPLQRLGTFDHHAFYLDEARRLRALEIDLEL
jgi:triacylglycerol lipase